MPDARSSSVQFRATPDELREIDRRAKQYKLSRTQFIVKAALGVLDVEPDELQQRIQAVEERLERLEQAAFTGY